MKFNRVWTIYFSATGTTQRVVETLRSAIVIKLTEANDSNNGPVEYFNYNFTLPKARENFPQIGQNDIVIFGMPTYAGRLPNLILPYFDKVNGNGALAVAVVTFGNRAYENSLAELCGLLEEHGFHTISGGAFACEHSFSFELGHNRPDDTDLTEIKSFGEKLANKILSLDPARLPAPVVVEGDVNSGYYQPKDKKKASIDIRKVKPNTDPDKCIKCGLCASVCPMGSIDPIDFSLIAGKCIKCCACYKKCPTGAKFFNDPDFLYHKTDLENTYSSRRAANSIFI